MDNTKIKRVHVVYKTHLDLGFTAMAADVLETYRHEFIPRALAFIYYDRNGFEND